MHAWKRRSPIGGTLSLNELPGEQRFYLARRSWEKLVQTLKREKNVGLLWGRKRDPNGESPMPIGATSSRNSVIHSLLRRPPQICGNATHLRLRAKSSAFRPSGSSAPRHLDLYSQQPLRFFTHNSRCAESAAEPATGAEATVKASHPSVTWIDA